MLDGRHRTFKSRHLASLTRRYNFLVACEATDSANSYDKAERAALEAALPELTDILERRKNDAR